MWGPHNFYSVELRAGRSEQGLRRRLRRLAKEVEWLHGEILDTYTLPGQFTIVRVWMPEMFTSDILHLPYVVDVHCKPVNDKRPAVV